MNYADENYVRLYTRDTPTWVLLGWQGQTVLMHLMRRVSRAGVLDFYKLSPDRAVAAITGLPLEVVRPGLEVLLELEVAVVRGERIVLPNFIPAQETRQSDAARKRQSRESERARALTVEKVSEDAPAFRMAELQSGVHPVARVLEVVPNPVSAPVTSGHQQSPAVTIGHSSLAELSLANPPSGEMAARDTPKAVRAPDKPVSCPSDFDPPAGLLQALCTKHEATERQIRRTVPEWVWYWRDGKGAGKRRSLKGWHLCFAQNTARLAKSGELYTERTSSRPGDLVRSDGVADRPLTPREERAIARISGATTHGERRRLPVRPAS